MRFRWWFVLAVGVQIAVLLVMVGMKWSTLAYGTQVTLKTRQVDPWDVFRGDYLVLNLEISDLELKKVAHGESSFKANDTVYVSLQQEGKYWVAKSVSRDKPDDGGLFIKGRVDYFPESSTGRADFFTGENRMRVDYGIDSYYIPQHQGQRVERQAVLDAVVSVDRWGGSALSRLLVNGAEIEFE